VYPCLGYVDKKQGWLKL